ncbi:MAG: hypothetical protein RL417_2489, partial [Pseudomonadota bacterium]
MAVLTKEQIRHYLKPIIRAFLRHGYSIHDLIVIGKELFIEAAQEELVNSGRKVNISRISVMTGLYRREISEYLKGKHQPSEYSASLVARVLTKWETSPKFLDTSKCPRPLSWKVRGNEFSKLVYSVSKDTHDGTILAELKRAGLVTVENDIVTLIKREALIVGDIDRAAKIVETNLEGCLRSAEENFLHNPAPRNLHLKTAYDNLPVGKLPELKRWILEAGRDFHQRVRAYLSSFDQDTTEDIEGSGGGGGKIVVTSYSFAELPPAPK